MTVGGGDELPDRPGRGGVGERHPLGPDQGPDLALDPHQVERGAHEGVVEIEDAERAHVTQYKPRVAARSGFGKRAGDLLR